MFATKDRTWSKRFPIIKSRLPDVQGSEGDVALQSVVAEKESKQLPLIVWIVVIATGFAIAAGKGLLGFRVSGLAWVIPLFFSALVILRGPEKIKFPFLLWLPWIVVLILYYVTSKYTALQRTVQLMCPLVVGTAVSTCKIESNQLKIFIKLCKHFSIAIIIIALFKTGLLLTGKIPWVTGLAAQAITSVLLCCLFAASYASGNRIDLFWWGLMIAFPLYAVTRTAILTAGLTLPLTFAPLSLRKRVVIISLIFVVGLALFYTERMQHKMFYSGKGDFTDIFKKGSSKRSRTNIFTGNFADSGRGFMWNSMRRRIIQKPWFGYGTGAGEAFIKKITGGLSYPHNDWLLTLHDQGIFGTILYSLCLILATLHALERAKRSSGEVRLLFLAGASSFIPFALIMFTDNIMIYASYFGNLQFTMLGLAYAGEKG
jgi:O-antigen ligase